MDFETLTPEEVGQALHLSLAQLYNLRTRSKGPPFVKIGALVRYPKAGFRAWIETGGDGAVKRAKAVKLAPAVEQPATVDGGTAAPTARERALQLGRKLSGDGPPTPETLPSFAHLIGLRLRDTQA